MASIFSSFDMIPSLKCHLLILTGISPGSSGRELSSGKRAAQQRAPDLMA
jgi:hypothetical protein